MKTLWLIPIASAFAAIVAVPAKATCLVQENPVGKADIILTSPTGKTVKRTTAKDGTVKVHGLRSGAWKAQMKSGLSSIASFTVTVGQAITLMSVKQVTRCNAPPNPEGGQRKSHPSVRYAVKVILP